MHTAQSSQEKRSIKVADFLEDFRSGLTDGELMDKYRLSEVGLEKFYFILLDRNILDSTDFEARDGAVDFSGSESPFEETSGPRFVCPNCLASRDNFEDACPNCGSSGSEFASKEPVEIYLPEAAVELSEEAASEEAVSWEEPAVDDSMDEESRGELMEAEGDMPAWDLDEPDDNPFEAADAGENEPPIEIPLEEKAAPNKGPDPAMDAVRPAPAEPQEFEKIFGQFDDDAADQVVTGLPLDSVDRSRPPVSHSAALCPDCEDTLDPGVHRMYDRKGSYRALAISLVFLVLGFAGAGALTFVVGYSPLRLAVIYFTGTSMLMGTALFALALFMLFFARERVYLCYRCRRIYPRV